MIGLFDSGLGGLTVLSALAQRFPHQRFAYLGDHAHAPYGNRPSEEVVELTKAGVQRLFGLGCRLVMLACNTATAVAARKLQREWLPASGWAQHNVIGIIAPTVEAATQTPWAVTTPQYPQKYNTDVVAVFATQRTVSSGVYPEEIRKRCPKVTVIEQACPALAGALEAGAPEAELTRMVEAYVSELMAKTGGAPPHRAILGCTHYRLIEHLFQRYLPPFTRLLSQPEIVADSLEDYLARHPHYITARNDGESQTLMLTTGDPALVTPLVGRLWPGGPPFAQCDLSGRRAS